MTLTALECVLLAVGIFAAVWVCAWALCRAAAAGGVESDLLLFDHDFAEGLPERRATHVSYSPDRAWQTSDLN